jgi:PucR C-terminal helix-turn-helix domain/Purine catabolism regulatory protein-like family/GGDEF-like domain
VVPRLLLRELLNAEHLGLRLLHAPPGALERPVGRVITTDLLEPDRYLSGGELVISGLVWRRAPADSETFVASLAGGGAVALAAGAALLGTVPDDVVEACRRHDVPLLEVPVEVAFADVTEYLASTESTHTSASLVRQRQLLAEIAAGRTLDELATRMSAETGAVCRVVTATGRHVVPGPAPLLTEDLDRVSREFLRAGRLPVVAAGNPSYTLFPVGSGLSNRLVSWIVVTEGSLDDEGTDAVNEFAAIVSLDRSRRDEGLRAVRPIAEEALALVESGGSQLEVAARLRQAGVDPAAPLVAMVVGLSDKPDLLDLTRTLVEDVALGLGPPVVAVGRDNRVIALLPAVPDLRESLRSAFGRLAPGLGRAHLTVGVSKPASTDALVGALDEARFARRLAEARQVPVAVVSADEVTSHVILLATVPDDVRRAYALRVLGRVLEYDERNDAGLVETLEAFMACDGSWSRTAQELHVHVNTVRYRIERVEEMTGRDLSRLEDRVDVFLALRSL